MNILSKLDSFNISMEVYLYFTFKDILNLLITSKIIRNITLNNNKLIPYSISFNLKYFKSQNGKSEDKSYNKKCIDQIISSFQKINKLILLSNEPSSIDESLYLLSNNQNIISNLEDL